MILGTASGMPVVAAVAAPDRHHHALRCPFCDQVHVHGGFGGLSPAGAVNGGRYSHCRQSDCGWYVIAEVPGSTRLWQLPPGHDRFRHEVTFDDEAVALLVPEIQAFIGAYEQTWAGPERMRGTNDALERRWCAEGKTRYAYGYFTSRSVPLGAQWMELDLRRPAAGKRCALYRHYDAAGILLYVGITDYLSARGKAHAKESTWVQFADTCTAKWYPSRDDALVAERAAIEVERPIFNRAHNTWAGAEAARTQYLSNALRHVRVACWTRRRPPTTRHPGAIRAKTLTATNPQETR